MRSVVGPAAILVIVLSGVVACEPVMKVELNLQDPCNQSVLYSAEHIDFSVRSRSSGAEYGAIWNAGDRSGELAGGDVIEDAVISVVARESNGIGEPGRVIAAGAVGLVDLAAGDDGWSTIGLDVTLGRVGTFINTTRAGRQRECTGLMAERHEHTATTLADGRVFIAGGIRQNPDSTTYWETTEIFDSRLGETVQAQPMAWMRRGHTATLLSDGQVLVAGGLYYAVPQSGQPREQTWAVAHLFDAEQEEFQAPVQMQPRAYHSATHLADGRVLLIGGQFEGNPLLTTEVYDPLTNTTSPGPTLLGGRSHHMAVRVAASTVAVIGGQGLSGLLDTIEFVTVGDLRSVVAQGRLETPRVYGVAAYVQGGGGVLVAGGIKDGALRPEWGEGLASIELLKVDRYDLASSEVVCASAGLELRHPRGYASGLNTPEGFLVVGGLDAQSNALSSAEIVNVRDLDQCQVNVEETTLGLNTARAGAQLSFLPGGDVLVTGGISKDNGQILSVAQSEIYIVPR